MARKEKVRRLRVGVGTVKADCSWKDSRLVVSSYMPGSADKHEVIIEIGHPSEVDYLKNVLDEFYTYWKRQLGVTP